MTFPSPLVETYNGIYVVRDDLIPGGTKRRVIDRLLTGDGPFVYASPAYGYAQVALAHACRDIGKQAVIFTAERKVPHPRTMEARSAGAHIEFVPYGYLSNVQAKARQFSERERCTLLPFGFDTEDFRLGLTGAVLRMDLPDPSEIWTVAGSGTLSRSLQAAFPSVPFFAVQVGKTADIGRAQLLVAPESFERRAKNPPPFPSTDNYDAKAWQFVYRLASPGALFWNVAR